ncbi:MAG: DNA topoisomerase III [Rubrobacteraceae bacterium]|nr:DNA topoisomerase III [Rubrobacteraceae bacterium]
MKLIVAEKPSVARDIANALGRHRRGEGCLVGSGWIATWALGHLAELAPPEAYGERYKSWRLEDLPILPDRFRVVVSPKTREQFRIVKRLLRDPGVTEVVNACDAGREGELIFSRLYELSGCDRPVKRLWISSLTPEAIREGFASLRDAREMRPLEDAARSRSEADWIVGMNATRAFSVRFSRPGDVLSVGRVQTPTLRLLVDREREIEGFTPETFWTVRARFSRGGDSYEGVWFKGKESRLGEKEAAERIAERVRGGTGLVRRVRKKVASERSPLLYDLTALQRDANARFGFTAERTLKAAQSLYERRKLITYPRTSSRYLSKDVVPTLERRIVAAGALPALEPFASKLLSLPELPRGRRIVDDAKVTDHHAIIPTGRRPSGELPPDESRVLDLVFRRFLAVFFPEARFEHTTVVTAVGEDAFLSRGRVVLEAGWRALYPDGVGGKREKEPPLILPPVEEGQEWAVADVAVKEGKTKPPPRYSEATLLGAMETAGRLVEDEELRQRMKDSGLGTPATRAAIIERLIQVGYVEREKKVLVPTRKGRRLVALVGDGSLASPEMTARWEERLAKMERGEEDRRRFMAGIETFTKELVEEVRRKAGEKVPQPADGSIGACPKCGSPVVETKKAYSCSAWRRTGCDFAIWKTISGKRVSEAQARRLLEQRRTGVLKGFKSRSGGTYSAALVLDEEGKVRIERGKNGSSGSR